MALITEDHLEQQCLEWFFEQEAPHVAAQLDRAVSLRLHVGGVTQ
jgi:hypothetical protein